jgi:hypothetical protein
MDEHLSRPHRGGATTSKETQTKGPYRAPSAFKERKMAKQQDKKALATPDKLFVFGMDDNGKPRGARFAEFSRTDRSH